MSDKESDVISKKLDIIAKLLAFNIIADKAVNEQVDILTKAGLRVVDIAALLDKTENQIYVTQTMLRKKKKESIKIVSEQETSSEVGQNV
jgi:orotate phosphoribosyltransferase